MVEDAEVGLAEALDPGGAEVAHVGIVRVRSGGTPAKAYLTPHY